MSDEMKSWWDRGRFDGELGISSFYEYANYITWKRHKGFAMLQKRHQMYIRRCRNEIYWWFIAGSYKY